MYGITPYGRIFGGQLNLVDWRLDKQTANFDSTKCLSNHACASNPKRDVTPLPSCQV